jgi:hypothetical protein
LDVIQGEGRGARGRAAARVAARKQKPAASSVAVTPVATGPQAVMAVVVARAPKTVEVVPELTEYLRLTCAADREADVDTTRDTAIVA